MTQNASISAADVLVRTQPTPNPYALKFVVNQAVKRDGKATFSTPEEAEHLPLAYNLFLIDGVKQLHFFQNTITITHTGELEETDLIDQATAVIQTRIPIHDANFGEAVKPSKPVVDRSALSQERQLIEEILDRTIRPGLQADGGDVEVISFEDNQVRILYQGACGGCPSSMYGTLEAIQSILRHELGNETLTVSPI